MDIRREDKDIIQHLALLGMLFGAAIALFMTLNIRQRAVSQIGQIQQAQTVHSRLATLSSSLPKEQSKLAENVFQQVHTVAPDKPLSGWTEFWASLKMPHLVGICGAIGIGGGLAGYILFGFSGWVGSLGTYWLIRALYRFRPAAPDHPAEKRCYLRRDPNSEFIERQPHRTLPMVIKLLVLLACVLTAVGVIVWQLTAI